MNGPLGLVLAAVLASTAAGLWAGGRPMRSATRWSARAAPAPRDGAVLGKAGWMPWRKRGPLPILALLVGLAAELATGQPTGAALDQASRDLQPDPCPNARRAARSGGDVADALRLDAERPGGAVLRNLAACWEVAEHSGAGLALAVERLADGVRAGEQARAQLAAEVAAARASARLLAALPLMGLLIGQWIGANPLVWLTGTWIGRLALLMGLGLEGLGLLWLRRMVSGVEEALT